MLKTFEILGKKDFTLISNALVTKISKAKS